MHRAPVRAIATVMAALLPTTVVDLGLSASPASAATPAPAVPSAYVAAVLADGPTALLQGTRDLVSAGSTGMPVGGPAATTLPNGDPALAFDGRGQYLQFPDSRAYEVDATGVLTVEFWMRPDTLQFADEEGSGYVYTMGKGQAGAHEWYARMYSKTNAESRPNRISGYVFNPAGGLGAGSFFQDAVSVGQWIHVALVINTRATSAQFPLGYTRIYKNGVLRDTDSLKDYDIVPRSGAAPLRIGTGYLNSFFRGAVGDVAFYAKELSATRLAAHHAAISAPALTPPPATTTWAHVLDGTNVSRGTDQLIRYTPAHGRATGTNAYGFEATVVGGRITAVSNGTGAMAIPGTGYVLSGHGTSRQWLLEHAEVGATVAITSGKVTLTVPKAG